MAPFPEAEIMTIKRLEVALRKMDFKLLKDGAYKLHEKYHSGYRFTYPDMLKDIYMEVINNPSIPYEVKDILAPTIEDILEQCGMAVGDFSKDEPYEENRVSTLTSLSYSAPENKPENQEEQYIKEYLDEPSEDVSEEEIKEIFAQENKKKMQEALGEVDVAEVEEPFGVGETKINAFDAFSAPKSEYSAPNYSQVQPQAQPHTYFTNSPFSAQPFAEFNHPVPSVEPAIQEEVVEEIIKETVAEVTQVVQTEVQNEVQEQNLAENIPQTSYEPNYEHAYEPIRTEVQQEEVYQEEMHQAPQAEAVVAPEVTEVVEEIKEEVQKEVFEELEEVSVPKKSVAIFYAQDSSDDKIRNILKLNELIKNPNGEIFGLISEIKTQAYTNVVELQGVLDFVRNKEFKYSLITNSQSSMLTELEENVLGLYGLANRFKCSECEEKYLDFEENITPLVLECPNCKGAMYPELYAPIEEAPFDMNYYNNALIELANADVWLLIHPTYMDKKASNMLETALQVSSKVKEIYVLDKDINVRETYKKVISEIKPDVAVNAHPNTLEDFFNQV